MFGFLGSQDVKLETLVASQVLCQANPIRCVFCRFFRSCLKEGKLKGGNYLDEFTHRTDGNLG